MFSRRLPLFGVLGLAGLVVGAAGMIRGQDLPSTGIVRITDSRNTGVQPASLHHHAKGAACPECNYSGAITPYSINCNYGNGIGYGSPCYGSPSAGYQCYGAGSGYGCPGYGGYCGLCGIFHDHYCTHSPDHGYSVPAKYPIIRLGVQYNRFWPTAWYGTPGVNAFAGAPLFPMVYQPTDTTQLGFYYQHVPYWQPVPNPLPPRPIPAQWHILAQPVSAVQRYGIDPNLAPYPTTVYGLGVYEGVGGTPAVVAPGAVVPGTAPVDGMPLMISPEATPLPGNPAIPPAPAPEGDITTDAGYGNSIQHASH